MPTAPRKPKPRRAPVKMFEVWRTTKGFPWDSVDVLTAVDVKFLEHGVLRVAFEAEDRLITRCLPPGSWHFVEEVWVDLDTGKTIP